MTCKGQGSLDMNAPYAGRGLEGEVSQERKDIWVELGELREEVLLLELRTNILRKRLASVTREPDSGPTFRFDDPGDTTVQPASTALGTALRELRNAVNAMVGTVSETLENLEI